MFCALGNKQTQQISLKHCLINFVSDKGGVKTEQPGASLVDQQRQRPSEFKFTNIKNYKSYINIENLGMLYVYFKE